MNQLFNIFWDVKADKSLDEIHDFYLDAYSKKTADKVRREFFDKIEILIENPEVFPLEPLLEAIPGNLRYILVRHFKIIYEFTGQEIIILHIFNTNKNPDNLFDEIKE
jgi:plasmid stabilization system protein ParE